MKKLITLLLLLLATTSGIAQHPYHRKTKHKPVAKMKRWELRKVQTGHNLYYRENGKVHKTGRYYSGIKRPQDATITKTK